MEINVIKTNNVEIANVKSNEILIQDVQDIRFHHEIYLSDPRRSETSKLKTVIRHPIKKIYWYNFGNRANQLYVLTYKLNKYRVLLFS